MNYATPTQEYARDEDRAFISNKLTLSHSPWELRALAS